MTSILQKTIYSQASFVPTPETRRGPYWGIRIPGLIESKLDAGQVTALSQSAKSICSIESKVDPRKARP
jgi:hypothetical protein